MPTLVGLTAIGTAGVVIIALLRPLFFFLDTLVYSWCGGVFSAAMGMYDINKFMETSDILSNFADLIYSFLAIFMFFKVAFSLLTMIVDPAQIEDKQKGVSKLLQNIFVCLALIVAVPAIFNGARTIQTTVIEKKVIENAIYGEKYKDDSNVGDKLAIATWSLFIQPTENASSSTKKLWNDAFNLETASDSWEVRGNLIDSLNEKTSGKFEIGYIWGISTILGVYLLWTFIKLAIDVAYRSLKFLILQLVSPIAIVSYIDPKSGKDGIFAKWTKECIKTYISLFVRIFIYALASTIMVEFSKSTFDGNVFNKIIYLLAIVALIKSGPKIFDNIFGTEISKDSETKFASDMLRGAAGAGVGFAAGGISGAVVAKKTGNNITRGAWEGIKKGATSGYTAGKKGGFDGMVGVIKAGAGGQKASADYFGVKSGREADKLNKQRTAAGSVSDHVEDLKNANGFKKAINNNSPNAIQNAAQNSKTWAQRKFNLDPNDSKAALILENMEGVAEATDIHQSDKALMIERSKVFDDIAKNQSLVAEGKLTQDEANILNRASKTKYNKLAAQKDVERITEEANNAANYATQLQTMSRQELETKVQEEINSLSAKTNRTTEEENRFNQLRSKVDTTTGKVKTSVSTDEMIEHISQRTAKSVELRDARSQAAKTSAVNDKASNAVAEFKNSNTAGSEYYKAIEIGDKIRGR